jgi:hypothetical protein
MCSSQAKLLRLVGNYPLFDADIVLIEVTYVQLHRDIVLSTDVCARRLESWGTSCMCVCVLVLGLYMQQRGNVRTVQRQYRDYVCEWSRLTCSFDPLQIDVITAMNTHMHI